MRVTNAALTALLTLLSTHSPTSAQQCITGAFTLEFTGTCNAATIQQEYKRQIYEATGNINTSCAAGSTAEEDLNAKLDAAGVDLETLCHGAYDAVDITKFHAAARQGTDYAFEQHFYNGRTYFQEEVETIYETPDNSPTSILKVDAKSIDEFYLADGTYGRVEWPNMLTNFDDATCSSNTAMCCWTKDRQAGDNNGNCARPYDVNCVDKDPADNTDLCFVDMAKGNLSNEFDSNDGLMVFPEDNNNGEGAIHCHGLAWANDEYEASARYKGNNLFYVSMYDHMYQRGYVKNVPGAPMCGCIDQMPIVSRSDCTQVDLTEEFKLVFDGSAFRLEMTKSEIKFNACKGRNNRNNDLYAYAARLYDEGRITNVQFGQVGRTITDAPCDTAVDYALNQKGLSRGFTYDTNTWTKVAGREDLKNGERFGKEAFYSAFFDHSLTAPTDKTSNPLDNTPILMRVCATCIETHKYIYYRRLTPISNPNFSLLDNLLWEQNNGGGDNVWNEDFTMHSTYDDAVSGANPWACPGNVYDHSQGFPGRCSPTGVQVNNQQSNFGYWWDKNDVAWFVNKPENEGIQDFITTERSALYTDLDIGYNKMPGTAREVDGVLYIDASGGDVWGQADTFHYLSQQGNGDTQVDVHLSSFSNIANDWAKAGIMLRADNSEDSQYVFAMMTGRQGVCLQYRASKGASSGNTKCFKDTPWQTATWLRVVKKMEKIEMWTSDDGIAWTFFASTVVLFPGDSYRVGLAVTSHDQNRLSEAKFENYEISEYNFPSSSPSVSLAPTVWDPTVDVGKVQRVGEFYPENANGITVLKGSGTGTWGSNDSFFYHNVQKDINSDFNVVVFVNSFSYGWQNSKGGIMIRDSNEANAAHAFIAVTGQNQGVAFQSRLQSGAPTTHHALNWIPTNNVWLKLSKQGNTITGFYKHSTASTWTEIGSVDLVLTGSSIQVGIATTAGDPYQWAQVQLDVKEFGIE